MKVAAQPPGESDPQLPIDINYRDLVDWLVSRKKLAADWRKRLAVLHKEAAALSKDLPPGLLASLSVSQHSDIHYATCKKVLEELSKTNQRGMFGGLTGPAKEWAKVVRVYEKGNVYLGEASQILTASCDYEIPFMRKQALALDSQLLDLKRKAEDLRNSAHAAAGKYQRECEALGIKGINIRAELQQLIQELPAMFSQAVESCRQPGVLSGIQYHAAFLSHTMNGLKVPLTTLSEVINGNTEPMDSYSLVDVDTETQTGIEVKWEASMVGLGDGPGDQAVNWDIDDPAAGSPAPAVNWDFDDQPTEAASPAVNWDFDMSTSDNAELPSLAEQAYTDASVAVIDWGIDMTETGLTSGDHESLPAAGGHEVESTEAELCQQDTPSVARLVGQVEYRNKLLADLTELQAFLFARHCELRGQSTAMLNASTSSEVMQQIGAEACADMLADVTAALSCATNDRLRQLLMFKTSSQYMARMQRALEMKSSHEARYLAALQEVEAKADHIQRKLVLEAPKLKLLIASTADLKATVETALADLLGRKTNIVGEINMVLKNKAA